MEKDFLIYSNSGEMVYDLGDSNRVGENLLL